MRLSRQLMLVSLLMLGLPWAGCQYLAELEGALRQGQEQSLAATAGAIAAALAADTMLINPDDDNGIAIHQPANDDISESRPPIYAENINWPIIVDGYDNEWTALQSRRFSSAEAYPLNLQLRAAIRHQRLYLYLQVIDDQVRYQNPAYPRFENGDRLIIHDGQHHRYVLLTSAPGQLPAYRHTANGYPLEQAITAQWQDTSSGYGIEIAMPLRLLGGRLGITLVDEGADGQLRARLGNFLPDQTNKRGALSDIPALVYLSPQLNETLRLFQHGGQRLRVINNNGWQVATHGDLNASNPGNDSHWLSRRLYRMLLREEQTPYPQSSAIPGRNDRLDVRNANRGRLNTAWYQDPQSQERSILSVATPILREGRVHGVLLAEESNERFLGLTDNAFQRLLLLGLGAFMMTGVGLISYAVWLSWRIRRLNTATSKIMDSDGHIHDQFPNSQAGDEIGELTRSFKRLFNRISHYTDYLRTLSSKLTHELRTPLAVVRSSLDNLAEASAEEAPIYLQRARDGAERLSLLISSLSEATRIEEAIQQAEKEPVNVAAMVQELMNAYQELHPGKTFKISGMMPMHLAPSRTTMLAAPELIAQMFDKLIANAVDFTPDGGEIHFQYQEHGRHIIIDLSNDGPLLPAQIKHQIFDQLISHRKSKGEKNGVHLGLGLYIVRLIVEFHDGHIRADNRPDKRGVNFCISLSSTGPKLS